jgi:hypothetical protein
VRVFYRSRPAKSAVVFEAARRVEWCCADMCRQWGRLIGFGVPGHPHTTDRDVNIVATVPQANGGAVLEIVPIAFCPFCGQAVETVRVKRQSPSEGRS